MATQTLTTAQRAAIEEQGSAVLVSAAAGSGKTKVLVERLMNRLCDSVQPHDVDEFLIITFTKKAATELRGRIVRELSERLAQEPSNRHLQRQLSRVYLAQISTVHSFCTELLRQYAYLLELPADFRVLETAECAQLRTRVLQRVLEQAYTTIGENEGLRSLVDTLGAGRDDRAIAGIVEATYNTVQCHIYPGQWVERCVDALDMAQYADLSQTPWGAYLLDSFHSFADEQLENLQEAHRLACDGGTLQKKCAPVLERNIEYVRSLTQAQTWDALYQLRTVSFGTMTGDKKYPQPEVLERIKYLRSSCRDALKDRLSDFAVSSDEGMQELTQTAAALRALFALVQAFSDAYRREKLRLHALDFGDLEHDAVRLLCRRDNGAPTAVAREVAARFTQIMVDEYQDTNEVQDCIFRAVSDEGRNRFMVGDVKQSIYRFRLADPGIFIDKYKRYRDYREAADGEPRRILLSENFRSGAEILDAANAVFAACMSERVGGLVYGEQERLREGVTHIPLPDDAVELHCISTKTDGKAPDKTAVEAAFVAKRIRRLLSEGACVREADTLRPVRAGDIVILLRSAKSAAPTYLAALRAQGIACSCDADVSVLDTQELESLVSLLQVLDNAHQDIPLTAALLSPIFGFRAQELAQLRAAQPKGDLRDALTAYAQSDPKTAAFLQTLEQLRDAAQQLPLTALLEEINDKTALNAVYAAMPNGAAKLANLRWFFSYVASFCEDGKKSLHQLLTRLDAEREQKLSVSAGAEADAVRIMSIHKSKGLEFPVVILADLSRKFNTEDLKESVLLHPTLGAGSNAYDASTRTRYPSVAKRAISQKLRAENVSEELRVLYVAMTRARDRLIMTYCAEGLQEQLAKLAQALTLPPKPSLSANADCLGAWVLETALLRTEAGELFAFGGRPAQTQVSAIAWCIRLHEAQSAQALPETATDTQQTGTVCDAVRWGEALSFRYCAQAATQTPSKITATQLKGRALDEESAEGGEKRLPALPQTRVAFSAEPHKLTATERGTATHLAMQYMDFSQTETVQQLEAELARMVEQEFLTPEQAKAVAPQALLRVFEGPVGAAIRVAKQVIREFKFSVLTDAGAYYPDAAGEQIMLQGVTDCCLVNPEGLTVIDFKTDRVQTGGEAAAAAHYRGQLEAYSAALSRIFGLPVQKKLLYFFATDTVAEV